jgi:Uma2 family endonuclease
MSVTKLYTAEDLWAMGSDTRYELIEGELTEVSPSELLSSQIAMNIAGPLHTYVRRMKLGLVSGEEGGFILSREPDTVVAPDVAFVHRERMYEGLGHGAFGSIPPDLAVEVMSHSDRFADSMRKAQLYLAAGTRLVWVVRPSQKSIVVLAANREPIELRMSDSLNGEDVVPGFVLPLTEVFD